MNFSKFLYETKIKENKTHAEQYLTLANRIIANISEVCVQESKQHYSAEVAIRRVRKIIKDWREDGENM